MQERKRVVGAVILGTAVGGMIAHSAGSGLLALWLFVAVAVLLALVLPPPYALVSPLFAGLLGWLVDMLPLVILAGWAAAMARGGWTLLRDPRRIRGWWLVVPVALVAWTALGIVVVSSPDLKHFALLVAIQVLASGTVIVAGLLMARHEDRVATASALVVFVIVLSIGVLAEWVGVPVQELQDRSVSERVEEAYGLDAFPNLIGMMKYTWNRNTGAGRLNTELKRLRLQDPSIPPFDVFRPDLGAYDGFLVVRFVGSAKPAEDALAGHGVELIYDNVGLAPAQTVPRLRSFPRNALTYAGVCAAIFPLAFYFAWVWERRGRWMGFVGIAACLFGAGMSLARGAWAAIVVAIVYLIIDGLLSRRRKLQVLGAFLVAALALTMLFMIKYNSDPLTARAGAEGSTGTRLNVYGDTIESLRRIHLFLGFGVEEPRTETGVSHQLGSYIPRSGTHSTYINYLFRTGIPGALLLVTMYVLAFLHARAAARARSGNERIFLTLMAAAVVTVIAHGAVLSLFVEPIYTLVISLVIGLAIASGTALPRSILPRKRAAPPT